MILIWKRIRSMVHWLAADLAAESSFHEDKLHEKQLLAGAGNSSCFCVNLGYGYRLHTAAGRGMAAGPDHMEIFGAFRAAESASRSWTDAQGYGPLRIMNVFYGRTALRVLSRKTQPLSEIADRFSLSFYNNTGFSYVVGPGRGYTDPLPTPQQQPHLPEPF